MFYFYLVASAALIPILDIFFDILQKGYSWWLVPVLFIGFFLGFILLHAAVLFFSVKPIKVDGVNGKVSRYYRGLINSTVSVLVKLLRITVNSTGEDKVPEDGRFLLVCNHLDNIDPAVIIHTFPNQELAFVGKDEILVKMPFVAKAMYALNSLFLNRDNDREAAKTIINAIKLVKEDKVSIAIFPEGYTSKTQKLLPMRNGAFKIATKAGVPIVICTVLGTPQTVKHLFIKHSDIYFDVVDVIPAERVAQMDTTAIGEYVTEVMQKNLDKRRAEHPEYACIEDAEN